jgi:sulfate adenylyltransferase subunit 2
VTGFLQQLEDEALTVLREVAGQFSRPALLFSGGKDSIAIAWLARKAFWPGAFPFPLLHIDTGHNFPETLTFRDHFAATLGATVIVASVQRSIDEGRVSEEKGPFASRNALQTVTLLDSIAEHGFDCCIGGARRDEEKARAKERFFSHRNRFGGWEPRNQRPELWGLYNTGMSRGEHFRVFPLSNFTERDVWQYLWREKVALPKLYFAHRREVIERDGMLLAASDFTPLQAGEVVSNRLVRFRTIGDMTCTGAVESTAATVDEVLAELAGSVTSERGTRYDDRRSEAAMEDRKRQGYF